ncbi:hypothetical protein D9M70_622240 [compost metagenome]
MADLDLVAQCIKDLIEDFIHAINVMRLKIIGRVHQQAKARMINLRKHLDRFFDRTNNVVHIGFEQEHSTMIIGKL